MIATAALARERGEVAYDTALGLGYHPDHAIKYGKAARDAARQGLAGDNPYAGRLSIGRTATGQFVLSVRTASGSHYNPTQPSSPGNSMAGSD